MDLTRRGLFGLLAAAPVVAALPEVKKAIPAVAVSPRPLIVTTTGSVMIWPAVRELSVGVQIINGGKELRSPFIYNKEKVK